MTTIINTPPAGEGSDSGSGIVLGVIVGIILVALFIIYGLPAIRDNNANDSNDTVINVTLPGKDEPTQ